MSKISELIILAKTCNELMQIIWSLINSDFCNLKNILIRPLTLLNVITFGQTIIGLVFRNLDILQNFWGYIYFKEKKTLETLPPKKLGAE